MKTDAFVAKLLSELIHCSTNNLFCLTYIGVSGGLHAWVKTAMWTEVQCAQLCVFNLQKHSHGEENGCCFL